MAETRATTALILTIAAVALVGLVLINDDGEATRESVSSVVNEARAYEVDPETAFIEKGESLNKILKSVTSTKAKSTKVQNGVVDDGEDNDITKTNSVGKNRITGDGRNNGKQAKAGFTDADAYTGKDGHYYLGPSRRRIGAGFGRRRRTPETKVVSKSDEKALSKIGLKPAASASASAPAPAAAPVVDVPPPATNQGNQILDKAFKSAEASAPSPAPAPGSAPAPAPAAAPANGPASYYGRAPGRAPASYYGRAPRRAPKKKKCQAEATDCLLSKKYVMKYGVRCTKCLVSVRISGPSTIANILKACAAKKMIPVCNNAKWADGKCWSTGYYRFLSSTAGARTTFPNDYKKLYQYAFYKGSFNKGSDKAMINRGEQGKLENGDKNLLTLCTSGTSASASASAPAPAAAPVGT